MELEDQVSLHRAALEYDQLKRTALAEGNIELASQARLRKVQVKAKAYASLRRITDAVEVECIEALFAYEEVRSERVGRTVKASRTWPMFDRHGVLPAVERVVNRPDDATGYTTLVEMGLEQYAFEAIVLRSPDRFSRSCVARSKMRLEGLAPIAEVGNGWTESELADSVKAYLDMQRRSRDKQIFTKKGYYRQLAIKHGRSEKAYEYRMQNISYVLALLGREWLPGLKPAKNVGRNIAATIQRLISEIEGSTSQASAAFEIEVHEAVKNPPSNPPQGINQPNKKVAEVTQYDRDPKVKAWVLLRAKGKCECCTENAPFIAPDGTPYLEVHHVRHMADGGPDTISNTVALCPNCHRELHYGMNAPELIDRLFVNVSELLSQ